jgi:hypothetical protein
MCEALADREIAVENGMRFRLKDNEAARKQVNYDYWQQHCQVEMTELVLTARHDTYRAEQYLEKFKTGDLPGDACDHAQQLFDTAFYDWAKAYKEYPWLVEHEDGLRQVISQYQQRIMIGKPLPDSFPLRHIPDVLPRKP